MLKKLSSLISLAVLAIILIYNSCDYKSSSEGEFDHIYIFADSTLFVELEQSFGKVFDKFIYTPASERSFLFKLVPLRLLDSYKKRRNLVFVGLKDNNSPASEYVKKMLSPELKQKIENGELFEIFKENLLALDQIGLIIYAKDKDQLLSNLENRADQIYKQFEDYHYKRLSQVLFSENEQTTIEDYLKNEYGWNLRVPYSYQMVESSKDSNFVWIKRTDPSRSIFIFRTKGDTAKINEVWIRNIRDSLASEYFDGDSVDLEDTYTIQTEFNGIPAHKMIGVWQNSKLTIGGPFRTYVFYEAKSAFIYFVDISVVAPGKRKKPYLDQLEVMAKTFSVTSKSKK